MTSATRTLLQAVRIPAAAAALIALAGTAWADCNADFAALMTKRMTEINALNQNSKAHKGKLDPVAACPQLRSLAAAENEVVSYMDKNKAWCNLPDDIIDKMRATHAKTATYASRACGAVVKMKEMQREAEKQAAQSQAQQQQAIKLPTGPL